MPSGALVLDSLFNAAPNFASIDADTVEDVFTGTTVAEYQYEEDTTLIAGGIGTPGGQLGIGGFDIRALAIKNFRAEKQVTDLASEENTINIKGDIMALPSSTSLYPTGWTPASDAYYVLQISNESGTDVYWTPPYSSTPVSSPVAGKVGEIDLDDAGAPGRWDGIDSNGDPIQGLNVAICQVDADNPDGLTYSVSRPKGAYALTYNCPSCQTGSNNIDLGGISYTGHKQDQLPASLGYGWASEASSRIIDQPGELILRSGGGSLRWVEQSGSYVPVTSGNYTEAEVDLGSTTARYKLTFKNQTVMEFDTSGKLQRKVDRNGNALTYSYDSMTGHLETVEDGNGRSRHYTTRTDGQPLTMRVNDPSTGRLTQYFYYGPSDPDAPNRLARITDPEGNETDFYYYTDGPLWAIIDPEGNVASVFGYDDLNRLYVEESYGRVLRTHYWGVNGTSGRSSHEVVEEDLVGSEPDRAVYMELDRHGNVVRQLELVDTSGPSPLYNETLMEYNDPNNPNLLTKRIDPNLTTTIMTYTANGNVKTVTDKDGNVTTYTYAEEIDSPLNPKHRNLIREVERPEVTVGGVAVTYDPVELQYDSDGNLIKVIDPLAEETDMTYTADGLVATVTNRLGHTTEFVYEGSPFNGDSRNLLEVKTPKGDSAPDGFRTVTFEYDAYDNVTSVEDDMGNEVLTDYDDIDRAIEITDPLGEVTTFTYSDTLLQDILRPPNNGSGSNDRKTSMVYDSANRLVEVKQDIDSIGTQQMRVKYAYNAYSQMSALTRIKNSSEKSFTFQYDQLGRQVSASDSLAVPGVTTTAYEPYCVGHATTTARGVRRKMSFDNRCLLTQVESGDIDVSDPLEVDDVRELREWEYDELGRLVKSSQTRSTVFNTVVADIDIHGASAEERTFEYDELDRLVKMTFEDSSDMLWEYDAEGNVTEMTDPEGKVTEYTYFRDNLLKEVVIKRSPDPDRVFTYSYDAAGRPLAIEFPSDTQIVAKFDDGTSTSGSGWDAKGQLLHLRYEKNGVLMRRFAYTYDKSGNRASQLDVTPSKAIKWEYGHDWLDRLVTVKRAEALTVGALPGTLPTVSIYTFDESDNRIEFELPQDNLVYTYTVDDADSLLTLSSQQGSDPVVLIESFTHDEDGNMTTRTDEITNEVISFDWDDFDRLLRVSSDVSGRKQDNRYHTEGLRKRKLDINDDCSNEYAAGIATAASKAATMGSSSPTISYVMGHQLLGYEEDGDFRFFLTDALGSVRDIVDDDGLVLKSYEFNEYGEQIASSGTGTNSPKTFVGALSVNDDTADSGLFLMGHRHYIPGVLGRFISRDPIGHEGGLNLHSYTASPVGNIDPNGLEGAPARVHTDPSVYGGFLMTTSPDGVNEYTNQSFGFYADLPVSETCSIPPPLTGRVTAGTTKSRVPAPLLTGTVRAGAAISKTSPDFFPLNDPVMKAELERNTTAAAVYSAKNPNMDVGFKKAWLNEQLAGEWSYEKNPNLYYYNKGACGKNLQIPLKDLLDTGYRPGYGWGDRSLSPEASRAIVRGYNGAGAIR
jgi:RHS repeat-associated protein